MKSGKGDKNSAGVMEDEKKKKIYFSLNFFFYKKRARSFFSPWINFLFVLPSRLSPSKGPPAPPKNRPNTNLYTATMLTCVVFCFYGGNG